MNREYVTEPKDDLDWLTDPIEHLDTEYIMQWAMHPFGMAPFGWMIDQDDGHIPFRERMNKLESHGWLTRFNLPSGEWVMPGPAALEAMGLDAPDKYPTADMEHGTAVKYLQSLSWADPLSGVLLDLRGEPNKWPNLQECHEAQPRVGEAVERLRGYADERGISPGQLATVADGMVAAAWNRPVRREAIVAAGEINLRLPDKWEQFERTPTLPTGLTLTGWLISRASNRPLPGFFRWWLPPGFKLLGGKFMRW